MTSAERQVFIERLLARLHDLLDRGVKADILVMVGRRDRSTGELRFPQMQIREFE